MFGMGGLRDELFGSIWRGENKSDRWVGVEAGGGNGSGIGSTDGRRMKIKNEDLYRCQFHPGYQGKTRRSTSDTKNEIYAI